MKNITGLLLILACGAMVGCAASSPASPPADGGDQGHRELKRGIYWYQKGCTRRAVDHFQGALEHYAFADRSVGVARSLNGLANVYRQAGDLKSAVLFYDAAIATAKRCDDHTVVAQALSNKAAVLIESDKPADAEVLLEEAQLLAREKGPVFAMLLNHRAVLLIEAQRYDDALDLLDQADAAIDADGINAGATIQFTRGRLMTKTGQYAQAMQHFQNALEMDREAGFHRGMADDLEALADLHELKGDNEAALDCLDRSLKIHALLGNREQVVERLDRLELLAAETGADIRVSVHFVNRWLAGELVEAICQ